MSDTSLMQTRSSLPAQNTPRVNIISALAFLTPLALGLLAMLFPGNPISIAVGAILGVLAAQSPKIARQLVRAVILRLGRYSGLSGPGLSWVVHVVDTIPPWLGHRLISASFAEEGALPSDAVL